MLSFSTNFFVMRKIFLALLFFITALNTINSQTSKIDVPVTADSLSKAKKDSIRIAQLFTKAIYPLIKTSKWSGVLPISDISEIPDPNLSYKLLFEVTSAIKDSAAAKDIHDGLSDAGRVMNLHVASGISSSKLDVVVVVHASALFALFNNTDYKKKFGIENPNIPLLKELIDNGVRIIACGQAMQFFEVKKEQMIPAVIISLTAQTVLSNYQIKGFVLYN